jgi:hypothetical protein
VLVWLGVFLVALDVYARSGDGYTGALIFVGLGAMGIVALYAAPDATRPGAVAVVVASVPTIYGFLIFPSADSFADIRLFLALTIATWALLFAFSSSRGRPILVALVAIVLWLWMVGEVANTDAYFAAPIPSPTYATPGAWLDAVQGGDDATGTPRIEAASFGSQQVTIDDLDPGDPLYPLAQTCASGDDQACDELWNRSEPGSPFEQFASTCGGSTDRSFPCAEESSGTSDDDLGDDVDDFEGDIEQFDESPLSVDPFGSQQQTNRTLEIGLVSLGFGALYLAAVRLLDQRRLTALGTAFVVPAVAALITAAGALGDKTNSAIWGGLITAALGLGIGVVGFAGVDRRFTTWTGGAMASVGALIVAADVSPEPHPSGDNLDLIGPGLVVLAFGLLVVAVGWVVHRALERRGVGTPPSAPPAPGPSDPWAAPPGPSDPGPPEPDSVPI